MKLRIDPDRCAGHGRCYVEFPDLFADDERGYGTVVGDSVVAAHRRGEIRLAVTRCPEGAITADPSDHPT
jgi:ferredoxin